MENHDKTGSEVHGFILFEKHTRNDTVYGMEQTVKEGTVVKEKIAELLIDSKNAVAVTDINQFKGHAGSAFHGIFNSAGGAETAVAAERNKLKLSAVRTAIHGTAIGRIAAVYHLIDIFHLNISRQGIRSGTQFRSTGFSLRTTGSLLGSTNYSVVSEQVCCSGLYPPQSSGQSLPG